MISRYERLAQRRQDEVRRLEAELVEAQEAETRAEANLDGKPRLRDRNKFFNALLHGELVTYEQIAPRWREYRLARRRVASTRRKLSAMKAGVDDAVRRGLRGDPGWRRLLGEVDREKALRHSAEQLLTLVQNARARIDRAGKRRRNAATPSLVDEDSREVAELVRAVRKHAITLSAKLPSDLSPNLADVAKLDMDFSGSGVDHKVRANEFKVAGAALSSLAGEVTPLIGKNTSRVNDAERRLARYAKAERDRFDEAAS